MRTVHCKVAIALIAIVLSACNGRADEESLGTAIHGRVLDADTFEPIPDALVFGYYIGTGGHSGGGSACYYGETVRADATGQFTFPVDQTPHIGRPFLRAYKRGYFFVFSPRHAQCDANDRNCEITVGHWNADRKMDAYHVEPVKYPTHREALAASREHLDAYLKSAEQWTREQKLDELRIRRPICMKPGKVTDGPISLLKAVLEEQKELGAVNSDLEFTQHLLANAERRALEAPTN